jgi:hypothetical protein
MAACAAGSSNSTEALDAKFGFSLVSRNFLHPVNPMQAATSSNHIYLILKVLITKSL